MRRRLLALSAMILLSCTAVLLAANVWSLGPYTYPSELDENIWQTCDGSFVKMQELCEVPEWWLFFMSTQDVIDTAARYPRNVEMFLISSDSPISRLGHIQDRPNIYRELQSRPNVETELVTAYRNAPIPPETNTPASSRLFYLEIILLQDIFWNELSGEEKLEVRDIAYQKYLEKLDRGYSEGAAREFYTTANRLGKDFPLPPPDTPEE